jgi:conjugal transfer pilus assembly protein TraL
MSKEYGDHVLLKTLDNPPRILFWELDEFLVMLVPVFAGIAIGSLSLMVAGLVLKPVFSKMKRRHKSRSLQHQLYWLLPYSSFQRSGLLKRIPPSHIREVVL